MSRNSPCMEYEDFEIASIQEGYYESEDESENDSTVQYADYKWRCPDDGTDQSRHKQPDEDDDADDDDYEEEEEDDEDDTDGDTGLRALAYDPNQLTNSRGLPLNGHDFLKLVQEERQRLPATVSVPLPQLPTTKTTTFAQKQHALQTPQKQSTQNSSTIAMEVLNCDEVIFADSENFVQPTQQSSLHPMETSVLHETSCIDSLSSTSTSDNDYNLEDFQNEHNLDLSIYSGMSSKQIKRQLRLKSLGCTPLNIKGNGNNHKQSPLTKKERTFASSTSSELLYRDQILANFLKLRSQIDALRNKASTNSSDNNIRSIDLEDHDDEHQKNTTQGTGKNFMRAERRATGLIKNINLGHPPQVDTLVHKSQMVIHITLDRLADQCEKAPMYSTLHADWIYSLIALLREPIEPDICSTLRRLAKLCIARRDSHERRNINNGEPSPPRRNDSTRELVSAINEEEYYACLLIICIVRYHFGQADLK